MNSLEHWFKECLSKRKYRSTAIAEGVAKKVKEERGVDLYIYCCPNCQGYHLTKRKEYKNRPS